jgi:uncharacterized membrane protein YeaQ/YmgE (transglycosylase-associated protein family)
MSLGKLAKVWVEWSLISEPSDRQKGSVRIQTRNIRPGLLAFGCLPVWESQRQRRTEEVERNMGILAWIVLGLIAGAIAKAFVPGEGPGGILGDIIVGIVGALIGGFVYGFFGHSGVTGFNIGSIVCAIIGAVILLALIRAFTRTRTV